MSFLKKNKLAKLKIKAYSDDGRAVPVGEFEAMFNPTTLSKKYEIKYGTAKSLGESDNTKTYVRNFPTEISLKLILDEMGVSGSGISLLKSEKTVASQIHHFLDLVFYMNGDTHEPNRLHVEWGDQTDGVLAFDCRLASVNISYTLFNREGSPLRAELDISLISDEEVSKRRRKENKKSPDLTHQRIVQAGDTLPLLCKNIYGKSMYTTHVARHNRLNNFRNLEQGQTLNFPPLDQLLKSGQV
ncbi:MAG: hypothetical protein DWQ05_15340 [Calditrichaeota bacterium]|nr:MAG: hypothetical protein DWQ05_15340 [Calditrichota bacterium]